LWLFSGALWPSRRGVSAQIVSGPCFAGRRYSFLSSIAFSINKPTEEPEYGYKQPHSPLLPFILLLGSTFLHTAVAVVCWLGKLRLISSLYSEQFKSR
jgi:hypothetical protein